MAYQNGDHLLLRLANEKGEKTPIVFLQIYHIVIKKVRMVPAIIDGSEKLVTQSENASVIRSPKVLSADFLIEGGLQDPNCLDFQQIAEGVEEHCSKNSVPYYFAKITREDVYETPNSSLLYSTVDLGNEIKKTVMIAGAEESPTQVIYTCYLLDEVSCAAALIEIEPTELLDVDTITGYAVLPLQIDTEYTFSRMPLFSCDDFRSCASCDMVDGTDASGRTRYALPAT